MRVMRRARAGKHKAQAAKAFDVADDRLMLFHDDHSTCRDFDSKTLALACTSNLYVSLANVTVALDQT